MPIDEKVFTAILTALGTLIISVLTGFTILFKTPAIKALIEQRAINNREMLRLEGRTRRAKEVNFSKSIEDLKSDLRLEKITREAESLDYKKKIEVLESEVKTLNAKHLDLSIKAARAEAEVEDLRNRQIENISRIGLLEHENLSLHIENRDLLAQRFKDSDNIRKDKGNKDASN